MSFSVDVAKTASRNIPSKCGVLSFPPWGGVADVLPDGVAVSQLYRPQWGCIFSRVIRMRVKKKGFVGFKNISFYQNVCTVGER